LALRVGLDGSRDAGNGVTFGLGIRLKSMRVDYAFAPMGPSLGAVHRMGISYRFGGAGEAAYQRGLVLSQRGDSAEAVLQFKEALDADPGHRDAARALREAIQNLKAEKGNP
jgi:tetratricopeptide (TPR) repeat protein